jgi:5'-nucleotidase
VTFFARKILEQGLLPDVDILKLDIPSTATPDTPWELTRQSRHRYYRPIKPKRQSWDEPGYVGYELAVDPAELPHDTDVYALLVKKVVSITPLSIDLTSRLSQGDLEHFLT